MILNDCQESYLSIPPLIVSNASFYVKRCCF